MYAKAMVNLDSSKPVANQTDFSNYEITARVYIRQKEYPYVVYSKEPHPKIVLTNTLEFQSESFELNKDFVQVDLPNQAELVFDFSEMVQSVWDTTAAIRQS